MNNKIQLYLQDMERLGVDRNVAAPPSYYLLWRNGLAIRPPIFGNFIVNALITTIEVAIVFYIIRFVCLEYAFKLILPIIPSCSSCESSYAVVILAIFFGILKAMWYAKAAKSLALPKWENYSPGLAMKH